MQSNKSIYKRITKHFLYCHGNYRIYYVTTEQETTLVYTIQSSKSIYKKKNTKLFVHTVMAIAEWSVEQRNKKLPSYIQIQ